MNLSRAAYIIIFLIGLTFGLFLKASTQPDMEMVKRISCETGFNIYISRYGKDFHPVEKYKQIRFVADKCITFSQMEH